MSQIPRSAVYRLIVLHLLLAVAPLGQGLMTIEYRTLPFAWCLISVSYAQVMLLAVWVGLFGAGPQFPKIAAAVCAAVYLAIWSGIAQVLITPRPSIRAMGSAVLHMACIFLLLVAIISGTLVAMRRVLGTIRVPQSADLPLAEPRFRFSLFALLVMATVTALTLGLMKMAQVNIGVGPSAMAIEFLLGAIVFSLNTLATIWATLGRGHVWWRLGIVLLVSLLLGFSFAAALYDPAFADPWWLFFSFPIVVVVPTTIVALTLLYLRSLGYRLIPGHAGS